MEIERIPYHSTFLSRESFRLEWEILDSKSKPYEEMKISGKRR